MNILKNRDGASYFIIVLVVAASLASGSLIVKKYLGERSLNTKIKIHQLDEKQVLQDHIDQYAIWLRGKLNQDLAYGEKGLSKCSEKATFIQKYIYVSAKDANGNSILPIFPNTSIICKNLTQGSTRGFQIIGERKTGGKVMKASVFIPYVTPIGEVVKVKNKAKRYNEFISKFSVELKAGTPIYIKDQITTLDSGFVRIRMNDGTELFIGPKSSLLIPEFNKKVTKGTKKGIYYLLKGYVRALFKKNGKEYQVRTRTAALGIRGTEVIAKVDESLDGDQSHYISTFILADGGPVDLMEANPGGKAQPIKRNFQLPRIDGENSEPHYFVVHSISKNDIPTLSSFPIKYATGVGAFPGGSKGVSIKPIRTMKEAEKNDLDQVIDIELMKKYYSAKKRVVEPSLVNRQISCIYRTVSSTIKGAVLMRKYLGFGRTKTESKETCVYYNDYHKGLSLNCSSWRRLDQTYSSSYRFRQIKESYDEERVCTASSSVKEDRFDWKFKFVDPVIMPRMFKIKKRKLWKKKTYYEDGRSAYPTGYAYLVSGYHCSNYVSTSISRDGKTFFGSLGSYKVSECRDKLYEVMKTKIMIPGESEDLYQASRVIPKSSLDKFTRVAEVDAILEPQVGGTNKGGSSAAPSASSGAGSFTKSATSYTYSDSVKKYWNRSITSVTTNLERCNKSIIGNGGEVYLGPTPSGGKVKGISNVTVISCNSNPPQCSTLFDIPPRCVIITSPSLSNKCSVVLSCVVEDNPATSLLKKNTYVLSDDMKLVFFGETSLYGVRTYNYAVRPKN